MRHAVGKRLGTAAAVAALAALVALPGPTSAQAIPVDDWALDRTGLREAWSLTTGEGVTIAIVDTGVDLSHPLLAGRLVAGRDFVDGDDRPDDEDGHGTHVAGIAAASAPGAKIMPVRVLGAEGGSDETIAEGIRWAVANGARVVNLSLGESAIGIRLFPGGALNGAIRDAFDGGAVVAAASGNEGGRSRQYRILVPVVVVGAIGPDDKPADFSNFGDLRAVVAPGVQIRSTAPRRAVPTFPNGTDGTGVLSGTSMATPFVSGEAALLLAQGRSPSEVRRLIERTAERPERDRRYGEGVIQAQAAARSERRDTPEETSEPEASESPEGTATATAEPTREPVEAAQAGSRSGRAPVALIVGLVVAVVATAFVLRWALR